MDRIKPFSQVLGEAQTLLRDDPQAALLEPVIDRAGQVAPGRIRLDDREGAFDGHCNTRSSWGGRVIAAARRGGNQPVVALVRGPRPKRDLAAVKRRGRYNVSRYVRAWCRP